MVCLACRKYSDRLCLVRHKPTREIPKLNVAWVSLKIPLRKMHEVRDVGTKNTLEVTDSFFSSDLLGSRGRPRHKSFYSWQTVQVFIWKLQIKAQIILHWLIFILILTPHTKLWFTCITALCLISAFDEKMSLKENKIIIPSISQVLLLYFRTIDLSTYKKPMLKKTI